jgi:hypothetical protein
MLGLHRTNSTQKFQALAIAAMILAIAPTVQAAPKMAQRVAMQDQPLCFVQLPGQTKNLDKLCGLGGKRKTADRNSVINLDIDVNRDGISDQLIEGEQELLEANEAAQKQFQIDIKRNPKSGDEIVIALNNFNAKLFSDFNARMPYSKQAKQLMAEENRLYNQLSKLPSDGQEAKLLQAKLNPISQKIRQDPSVLKVEEARRKSSEEIQRRGSAP